MTDRLESLVRLGDDLISRAKPLGKDLYGRGEAYGRELVDRYRPLGEDLVRQARVRSADALRRAEHFARPPEPFRENRSFLDSAAGQAAAAAAVGLAAGLVLNAARKAVIQGAEATAGDWLAVLKAEHRLVDRLFEALLKTTEQQTVRRAVLLSRISHALAKHAMQEEMVIYPALKAASEDSKAMHLYDDHAGIKIFIHDLQQIPKSDPLWIERARAFHACIQHHVREEEDEIFPAYHDAQSNEQNRRLTLMLHKEGLKLA